MMSRLLAALLACVIAGQAGATDLNLLNGPPSPVIDFTLESGSGVLGAPATVTRGSPETTGLYTDAAGSSVTSFTNNVAAFQASGLQSWETRTQQYFNSAVPATQTRTISTTGTYVFWCIGTGTITTSAGTLTATGLGAQACSNGSFQTISVTGTGTLVLTLTGSANRAQLEKGAFPSPFISSAAGNTVRSADAITIPLSSIGVPAAPVGISVIGKFLSPYGFDATKANTVFQIDDGTTSNRLQLRFVNTTNSPLAAIATIGGSTTFSQTLYAIPPASTTMRFWVVVSSRGCAAQVIGQAAAFDTSCSSLSGLTTLRLGSSASAGSELNSTLARLKIWNVALAPSFLSSLAAGL